MDALSSILRRLATHGRRSMRDGPLDARPWIATALGELGVVARPPAWSV
jgi:hypothetical protein